MNRKWTQSKTAFIFFEFKFKFKFLILNLQRSIQHFRNVTIEQCDSHISKHRKQQSKQIVLVTHYYALLYAY